MNRAALIVFGLGLLLTSIVGCGQSASRMVKKAERKQEIQKRTDRRNYERERERLKKEHFNRQTPEVQERMRQNERELRRKSRAYRQPLLKRWFSKKPR